MIFIQSHLNFYTGRGVGAAVGSLAWDDYNGLQAVKSINEKSGAASRVINMS